MVKKGQDTLSDASKKKRAKIKKEYLDPRQALFHNYYNDPESETFANAYQSCMRAGFSKNYAKVILHSMPDWLSVGFTRRKKMLVPAEKVLESTLEMDTQVEVRDKLGDIVGTKKDSGLEKIKQDSAKFVAERIGKEYWSARTELTGDKGGPIELQKIEGELKEWAKK